MIELQMYLLLSLVIIFGMIAATVSFFILAAGRMATRKRLKIPFRLPPQAAEAAKGLPPPPPRSWPQTKAIGKVIPFDKGAA